VTKARSCGGGEAISPAAEGFARRKRQLCGRRRRIAAAFGAAPTWPD